MAFYLPDTVISGAHTYGTIQHDRHLQIVTERSRSIHEDCPSYTCYYLCEESVFKSRNGHVLTNAITNAIELSPANSSLPLFDGFRFTECPAGHVTHVFLADDVSSHCFAKGEAVYAFSRAVLKGVCYRRLMSLPDLFECTNRAQRVPYTFVCDHRRDCLDNSDEDFCVFPGCTWQNMDDPEFECEDRKVCHVSTVVS